MARGGGGDGSTSAPVSGEVEHSASVSGEMEHSGSFDEASRSFNGSAGGAGDPIAHKTALKPSSGAALHAAEHGEHQVSISASGLGISSDDGEGHRDEDSGTAAIADVSTLDVLNYERMYVSMQVAGH
eukprot:355531-Chlamydomonas_euryale.AAC.1